MTVRHVPSTDSTGELDLLSFEDALGQYRSCEGADFDRDKWLYVPCAYSDYRYILGTKGENPLICIGINPSTAAPDRLDNTLKSVERIARSNGHDSFIMLNVYAQRATDPDMMEKGFNPFLHAENMKAFEYALGLSDTKSVWCAWGAIVTKRGFLLSCIRDIERIGAECGAKWYTAGARSKKDGHPHHPLYLRSDTPLEEFDLAEYVKNLT